MNTLTLKNRFQTNATLISNDFIDYYLAGANGEYVKVYLFLLRHLDNSDANLTISSIADFFDTSERDIVRAFQYWEMKGLLKMEYDNEDHIIGLSLEQVCTNATCSQTGAVHTTFSETAPSTVSSAPIQEEPEPTLVSQSIVSEPSVRPTQPVSHTEEERKQLRNLLFITEQYLGKTLSKSDVDDITYFYDTLSMPADLIEYLIEYCAEGGHKSMHYIKKVALNWHDEGVCTREDAKQRARAFNRNYYTILNAFGIKNRGPADIEVEFMQKWLDEYGFSLELVLEACNRTITATHNPSFEYADSILQNWRVKNVQTRNDVTSLDALFHKEQSFQKASAVRPKATPAKNMNNFERRSYDMDSLERRLLNNN